jgi:hypothetical protein
LKGLDTMPIPSIRRIALAASAAILLTVPAVAVSASAASAAPYPPGTGPLVLGSSTVTAGGSLSFAGSGFTVGERVAARLTAPVRTGSEWHDSTLLTVVTANLSGVASGTATIPRNVPSGMYVFSLTGSASGQFLSANISVSGLPGRPGRPGRPGHPGFPGLLGFLGFSGHHGRATAGSAPVDINSVPVANQVTRPENSAGRGWAAGGMAAALCAFGCGAYLMRRRRRG